VKSLIDHAFVFKILNPQINPFWKKDGILV